MKLKDSNLDTHRKMADFIQGKHSFMKTIKEATEKMLNGKYAFIGETSQIYYWNKAELCQLEQVGGELLTTVFHAIGMKKSYVHNIVKKKPG